MDYETVQLNIILIIRRKEVNQMLYKGNKIKFALVFTLVLILLVSLINPSNPAFAKNDKDPVEGAIYTTNKEGTENNKQHYTNKEEVYLYVNGNKFSNDHYYIRILSNNKKEVLGVSQEPLYITNEGENIYRLWDLVSYEDENGNIIQGYKDTKNPGGVYKIEISKDKNFDTSLGKSETFKVGVGKPDDPGNPEDPGDNENPEKPKEPEIPKQTEDPEEIIQIEDNEIPIGIPETLPQTSETIPYLSYIAGGILIILGNSIKKFKR